MPIEKPNTRSISSQTKTFTTPTPTWFMFLIQQIFKKKSSVPYGFTSH